MESVKYAMMSIYDSQPCIGKVYVVIKEATVDT